MPSLSSNQTMELQIRKIRQILIDAELEATDVSAKLWSVVSKAFQELVPATKDFNLYTYSPDEEVCSRVWPPGDANLPTDVVFGTQSFADELIETRGDEVLVHVFGGQRRRLLTARFETSIGNAEREALEWLSAEVGAALIERRQKRAILESMALRDQLQVVDDSDRANVLLQFFVRLLFKNDEVAYKECGGELRVACESSEDLPEQHLRLVAHTDGIHTEQPLRISSATKLVRQVVETKVPAVVVGRSEKYADLEPRMTSCVKLPVVSWDRRLLGIVCVHLKREYCFNLGMIHVAELLMEKCAAQEVERLRQPDEMTRRAESLRRMIPTVEELNDILRKEGTKWADARKSLYKNLSERARKMSKAFRTAVALVGPDHTTGVGVGGTDGDWGTEFDGKIIEFDDDNSGVIEALKRGDPYLVEDVDREGVRFLHIGNCPIGSTANIPISAGCNRLGVLNVEWVQKGGYDPLTIRYLTELCNVYGFVLNSVGIERHFVELENKLKSAERDHDVDVDYQGIMRLVAEMFGVREGAILIRNPDTARFYFTANLLKEDLIANPQAFYESDEGLTGWIITCRKTERRLLKKQDLKTGASKGLAATGQRPWKNKFCDNRHEGQNATSFLGAPIANGCEVFGVIRLNSEASIREFDSIDERNLTAVANRIAECLAQRAAMRRSRAKLKIARRFLGSGNLHRIMRSVFESVTKGIGDCRAHVRLVDKQRIDIGPALPLLARTATSDATFLKPTLFHGKETAAGLVWETGKPFDDQDVRAVGSPCASLCTPEFCRKVGSVYVVPLRVAERFVGTLHIYKEYRNGFNEAEKTFLREVAKIVASGILSVAERERAGVLNKVVATQENMLRRIMAGETFLTAQRHLLLDVLHALVSELQCSDGWLAMPASNGFEVCDKGGLKVELFGAVEAELSHLVAEGPLSGIGIATVPGLLRQLPVTIDDETQFVLLPVRVQDRVFAYFLLLHRGESVIRHDSIAVVQSLLDHLGEVLQLAQQVKDAQIGLPLLLLGTRASVLQHKSREPFASLKGLCERLLHESDLNIDERNEITEHVGRHISRLNDILTIMQELVQMATADPEPINVVDVIAPILDKLRRQEQGRLEARLELGSDCALEDFVVLAREGYLRTALEFILNNAREAIGKRSDGIILVRLQKPKPDWIFIDIIDNGCGMDREVSSRALEPGFSTKGSTGLGLPSAYSIIASHGGRLTLSSNLGNGTYCQISLPPLKAPMS